MGIYDQLGMCGKEDGTVEGRVLGGGDSVRSQISDSERCVLRARPPLRAYIQYNSYIHNI